jgi:predicted protein tyrosine phosphatase
MVNVLVMSQEKAESTIIDVPYIHISVYSPGSDGAVLPDNEKRIDVLRLCFHDIESVNDPNDFGLKFLKKYGIEPRLFYTEDAQSIIEFLEKHKEVETIVVNCEAGISRSAGIAAAIAKFRNGDDESYFKRYHPNLLAYKTLLKMFMEKHEKEGKE